MGESQIKIVSSLFEEETTDFTPEFSFTYNQYKTEDRYNPPSRLIQQSVRNQPKRKDHRIRYKHASRKHR